MQDWEIETIRKTYSNATLDQICEDCSHFCRFKSVGAQETVALLRQIIQEKLAEDEPSPAAWSAANAEKPKLLSPAEQKRREEKRIERITQGGRYLPPPKVESSLTQSQYDQQQNLIRARLPFKGVHSCPDCREGYLAPSCTSHCDQPGWWQAKRATFAETAAYEARRAEKD